MKVLKVEDEKRTIYGLSATVTIKRWWSFPRRVRVFSPSSDDGLWDADTGKKILSSYALRAAIQKCLQRQKILEQMASHPTAESLKL